MRHHKAGKKLGRDSSHRKALYANLAGALIEHGRIKTTEAKAKAVKPIAEQMITLGRRGGDRRSWLSGSAVVPEAPLEEAELGLRPAGAGWFVLNARDARWGQVEGRGKWPSLEGGKPIFQQLGVGLSVLEPGEPMGMYH